MEKKEKAVRKEVRQRNLPSGAQSWKRSVESLSKQRSKRMQSYIHTYLKELQRTTQRSAT